MPERATIARAAAWGIVLGLVTAVGVEFYATFFGRNWHVVIPRQAFRSAQLTRDQDRRDSRPRHPHRRQPPRHLPRPRLVPRREPGHPRRRHRPGGHDLLAPIDCRRPTSCAGWSRSSTTPSTRSSSIAARASTGPGLPRRCCSCCGRTRRRPRLAPQLGPRYGHVAIGPTRCMLQFLDLYEVGCGSRAGRTRRRLARMGGPRLLPRPTAGAAGVIGPPPCCRAARRPPCTCGRPTPRRSRGRCTPAQRPASTCISWCSIPLDARADGPGRPVSTGTVPPRRQRRHDVRPGPPPAPGPCF